jgi:hypothetical protein
MYAFDELLRKIIRETFEFFTDESQKLDLLSLTNLSAIILCISHCIIAPPPSSAFPYRTLWQNSC